VDRRGVDRRGVDRRGVDHPGIDRCAREAGTLPSRSGFPVFYR
jgi:hypothetical protein